MKAKKALYRTQSSESAGVLTVLVSRLIIIDKDQDIV